MNPQGRGMHCPRGDTPASVLRPYPVRQLDTSWAIRHQPHRAEEPSAVQDSDGELTSGNRIPRRQRCSRVVQRVRPHGARAPQGWCRLPARGLDQQSGIFLNQGPHVQVIAEVQIGVHELHPSPAAAPRASEYSSRHSLFSWARGRVIHARFLQQRDEDPDGAAEDPGELTSFERAAQLYRALGDKRGEAESLFWVGCFHQVVRRNRRGQRRSAHPAVGRRGTRRAIG